MKKLLLSASALMLAVATFAQTNAELSGNDKTASGNGYLYSFKAPGNGNDQNVANCTNAVGDAAANGVWNAFGANTASITTNANGGLEITISAQTVGASNLRVAAVRLSTGNCGTLQPGGYVDISAQKDIKIKASSSADLPFAVLVASDAGGWVTHDGAFNTATATSTSSTLTIAAADQSWDSKGDLTSVLGWELWIPAGTVIAADVTLTIEQMAFGDAQLVSSKTISSVGGSVYPNPATDVVNVNVGTATNATVELTDVTGKVVASVSGVSGSTAINTASVPAGLYVVSVKSANGVSTSKVVVK